MSIYYIPTTGNNTAFHPVSWEDGISEELIDQFKQVALTIEQNTGGIVRSQDHQEDDLHIRNVTTRIIEVDKFKWWYDIIYQYVVEANSEYFKYEIHGFMEQMQYLHYGDDINGGHYNWHIDCGPGISTRKLTVIVQLSHPEEYTGCEVQFMNGSVSKKKGSVTIFPSWMYHRVTKLTSGNRDSLVCWINGPTFR